MKPLSIAGHALTALALAAAGPALAGPIGEPWYRIQLSPRDANTNLPPELTVVLESPTDAVDGEMAGSIPLGPYVLPLPAQAELSAGVINDGQTFWAHASTPLATTLPRPPASLIGGDAIVELVQTFRKDSPTRVSTSPSTTGCSSCSATSSAGARATAAFSRSSAGRPRSTSPATRAPGCGANGRSRRCSTTTAC